MRAIKILVSLLLIMGAVVVMALGAMRFSDGPIGILAGGAFSSGELRPTLSEFGFLEGRELVEFQTLNPATSRTLWLVVDGQRLYFVSGYMNTWVGQIWKQWPKHILKDNAIVLRADGGLYPQQLQRLLREPEVPQVMRKFAVKYGLGSEGMSDEAVYAMVARGDFWMFEVTSTDGALTSN